MAIAINRAMHKASKSHYSYHGYRPHWHNSRPVGIVSIGRYHNYDENYDYYYYNERTKSYDPRPKIKCYTCEGGQSENCGESPPRVKQEECERGYYCSVTRTEYLESYVPPPTVSPSSYDVGECKTWRNAEPGIGAPESSREVWLQMMKLYNCRMPEPQYNPANTTRVKRGCVSPSTVRNHVAKIEKAANTTRAFKEYTTFCDYERCNVGDGHLRCYKCEGTGDDDLCMVSPSKIADIVTCGENEFCHIVRTVKMVNLKEDVLKVNNSEWIDPNMTMSEWLESSDNSTTDLLSSNNITLSNSSATNSSATKNQNTIAVRQVLQMSIVRSCKAYSSKDDDYEVDEGGEILSGVVSLSCASDLCNAVDGHSFSRMVVDVSKTSYGSAAAGVTISMTTLFSLIILACVLQ